MFSLSRMQRECLCRYTKRQDKIMLNIVTSTLKIVLLRSSNVRHIINIGPQIRGAFRRYFV